MLSKTKTVINKLLASFAFAVFTFTTNGQLAVTSGVSTPTQYVNNTLIGPGVVVSNVVFNTLPGYTGNQIGDFTYAGAQIPFNSGLIMASGNVNGAVGPNSQGGFSAAVTPPAINNNLLLNAIAGFNTYDAGILEFDFIPAGNSVSFNFTFASDEYDEYVCGSVNDVFGFFVTGTNPSGPNYANTNLALVPGTNIPISINTVNNGTAGGAGSAANCAAADPNWVANSVYYAGAPGTHFQADGMTEMITIEFEVVCGETYHFIFSIGDGGDSIFDSWVFLESGSFTSVPVDLSFQTNTGDTLIYEGCNTFADVIFTQPSCLGNDTIIASVTYSGTAFEGIDFTDMPDSVVFLPGEDTVMVQIGAFVDGMFEGPEVITVTVTSILSNGDTLVSTVDIWILDQPNIYIVAQDTTLFCIQDSVDIFAVASGGIPPYSYLWSTGDTLTTTTVPADSNGSIDYYVTVYDACLFENTDTLTVIVNQTLAIDSLTQIPSHSCPPFNGQVYAYVSGVTDSLAPPVYYWSDSIVSMIYTDSLDTVMTDLSPGWYYFMVTDDVCMVNDSIEVMPTDGPFASFSPNPQSGCEPVQVTFTNNSQNANYYDWDFGGGNIITVNNMSNQSWTFSQSTIVTLTAYEDATCFSSSSIQIDVVICGCTDPEATNYNPLALIENGSCVYPIPEVIAPNVFTPNSDFNNNFFYLQTKNAIKIELTILNRWGNEMFFNETDLTTNLLGPELIGWDGRTQGGVAAEEGTYFYKYVVTGIDGAELEGHGFLQLIRD